MIRLLCMLFLFLALAGCYPRAKPKPCRKQFKIPVIVQQTDTADFKYLTSDYITYSFDNTLLIGKFKFSDTLKISDHRDIHEEYIGMSMAKISKRYNDTLPCDGFQIFADYKSTIRFRPYKHFRSLNYYPVFVVNETMSPKYFTAKDGHIFGIQEAFDQNAKYARWKPIEYRGDTGCGLGYSTYKINPEEYVLILVAKYTGDTSTKLKVRLKIGNMIYHSPSFDGKVNPKQFRIEKDSYPKNHLTEYRDYFIQEEFYGAIPNGYGFLEVPED